MEQVAGVILMVLTSCGEMPDGKPTGVWLEEFSVPYEEFTEAGYQVVVASPRGGAVPVDPRSMEGERGSRDSRALKVLEQSRRLEEVDVTRYDAVFFPGGHGTMFDLPKDDAVRKTLRHYLHAGKPTALVCHGPAALVSVEDQEGEPYVKNRRLTAFSDSEERAVQLVDAVPFLLETRLRELGAEVSTGPDFKAHVVVDDHLITGQNPASSHDAAVALLQQLNGTD